MSLARYEEIRRVHEDAT